MTLHELVTYLNTHRNTELEVIPFSIQASKTYDLVFLRSKKEPHLARLTVNKLHHVCSNGHIILSAEIGFCLEEILFTDLFTMVVHTNAVAEKHGITQLINANCIVEDLTKMAEQLPWQWKGVSDIHRAIISFAKMFENRNLLERHEVNRAKLDLTETLSK